MANNKIQIKRSTTSAITNTTPSVSAGELVFTSAGYILAIGDPANSANVVSIGGLRVPGTLTANQALVANSTSGIDQVKVGNIALTGAVQTITANGDTGTAGYVFISGGTGANAYWAPPGTLSINVAAQYAWTNTQSFSNTITFGNATVNAIISSGTVNATAFTVGSIFVANSTTLNANGLVVNSTGGYFTGLVNSTSFNAGASGTGTGGTVQNTTIMLVGNNTVNTAITSAGLAVNGTATIANSTGVYTGTVNSSSFTAGAPGTGTGGLTANTTLVLVGNNTVNSVITSAGLAVNGTATIANSTGVYTGVVNGSTLSVGTTVVANSTTLNANGLVVNSTGGYFTGLVNSTSFNAGAPGTGTGGTVQNTTVMLVGNNTVNTSITSTTISVINSTSSANISPAGFSGNGIALTSLNASAIASGTLPDARLSAAVVNTSGSFTLAGNNTLGGTNTVISSNLTTTGATITGTATDVTFRNGTFNGNLTVSGTVVTVNTSQLVVNDNIIQLAYTQTTADTVDAGFTTVAGNATAIWYSGLARIAASSNSSAPVFRLFVSNTNPNTSTTIDTTANTRTGYLQSFLAPYGIGGALVANGTNITVAANSTLAVSLSANTLSLSGRANNDLLFTNGTGGITGLALNTTGGFVLQSNGTAIVYDTLDGGTF